MNDELPESEHSWLDRLDAIVEGQQAPAPEDDELLHLAGKLAATFAPLRELDAPARTRKQRLGTKLRAQLAASQASRARRWLFRPLMVAAAILLFLLLGPGLIFEISPLGQSLNHSNRTVVGWQMNDLPSVDQYNMVSPPTFPKNQPLLLPTGLGPNAYIVALNGNSYGSSTPILSYLVYTQHAIIYESPSNPIPPQAFQDSSYQVVTFNDQQGFISSTGDGQTRLEWYQDGLLCDIVSNILTVNQMVELAGSLKLTNL
ncbi:MAG TPA: hypothetical protein VFA41_12035 [Ktedonobacteraceae bacterium]|jgi:hypothetical protein|nr:hypothetical protein [Ktedonobacteraceae bacterium]